MKQVLALLLCCLVLAGCASESVETTAPTSPPPAAVETVPPIHFLTVYAPNEDATGFIYASWEVPEISAETICAALIAADVLNEDVAFNSLTLSGRELRLDVNEAFQRQLMSYGTAGEYMMVGSVVNTLLAAYAADTVFITCQGQTLESGHAIYDFPLEFYQDQTAEPMSAEANVLGDLIPMVMVDGRVYLDTGMESTVTARCGMMDGTIDSQVSAGEIPTQNNQSNFGVGYGYQYGPNAGTIEINIGGTWWVFASLGEYDEFMVCIEAATEEALIFDDVAYVDIPSPRAEALGVTPENTPGTFFLHNETTEMEELPFSPDCIFTIFDWEDDYVQKDVTAQEFASVVTARNAPRIPYLVTVENSEITKIVEQYVP